VDNDWKVEQLATAGNYPNLWSKEASTNSNLLIKKLNRVFIVELIRPYDFLGIIQQTLNIMRII
jgi:hypothetical protein